MAAFVKTGADVVGVVEVENDGYGPDSAIVDLVVRLNTATAPGTYAYVDADAETGELNALGTDAIKVGLIYKPAAAVPVGLTAVLNSPAFVNDVDGTARNRPALAQAFQTPSGGRFVAVVNHLKSKGSACDAPDGKPVVRGTRMPVSLIVGSLAGGMSFEDVQREYALTLEDIRAALTFNCTNPRRHSVKSSQNT